MSSSGILGRAVVFRASRLRVPTQAVTEDRETRPAWRRRMGEGKMLLSLKLHGALLRSGTGATGPHLALGVSFLVVPGVRWPLGLDKKFQREEQEERGQWPSISRPDGSL